MVQTMGATVSEANTWTNEWCYIARILKWFLVDVLKTDFKKEKGTRDMKYEARQVFQERGDCVEVQDIAVWLMRTHLVDIALK